MKKKLYCVVGKTCSGKDYTGNILSQKLNLPCATVSDLIKIFCIKQNIQPTRENMIQLWNTPEFSGKNIASKFSEQLSNWWIVTWIRKPETVSELSKLFDTSIIWLLCDDQIRYDRYLKRLWLSNKKDVFKTKDQFIKDEISENSRPNKQSINMIINLSDRYIHTPSPWYKNTQESIDKILDNMRSQQKQIKNNHHVDEQWYQHFARAIIKNQYGQVLLLHDKNKWYAVLPWGKIDVWENPQQAIIRELKEELWIENVDKIDYLWWIGGYYPDWHNKWHYFQVWTNDQTQNIESDTNTLWYYHPSILSHQTYVNTWLYHYENNWRFDHLDLSKSNDHLNKIHRI